MNAQNKSTRRIITLTGRPPVSIVDADWPIIARGEEERGAYGPGMTPQPEDGTILRVRQHADGRAIVYVTVKGTGAWGNDTAGHAGGALLAAGANLAEAIAAVGNACDVDDAVIRECVAGLPAEELDGSTTPQVTIPEEQWQEEDPQSPKGWTRLLAQITINGVHFHLDAIAVCIDDEGSQVACDATDERSLNGLADAACAGGTWDTIEIRGHKYVVLASPHC